MGWDTNFPIEVNLAGWIIADRLTPKEIYSPRRRASNKGPISVPLSPSSAVKRYLCREVALNYNRSLLFHGGDTGSTPVRDAKILKNLGPTISPRVRQSPATNHCPPNPWTKHLHNLNCSTEVSSG